MDKDKASPGEKEDGPKPEQIDLAAMIESAKTFLPAMGLTGSCEKTPQMCEVHIVGTPEMIQKILKID